jgi:hypothetical protein
LPLPGEIFSQTLDKNNPNEIKPEVYMVSDQAQALEREGFFTDSGSRKMMKFREP